MSLSNKQLGVLKGMIIGFLLALSILLFGAYLNPFGFSGGMPLLERLSTAILWCLVPILFLVVSVGRLAKHRFFTPEDIDGGGLSNGTEQARLLQALIQNTLEQTVLATFAYVFWSVTMPGTGSKFISSASSTAIPATRISLSSKTSCLFTPARGTAARQRSPSKITI